MHVIPQLKNQAVRDLAWSCFGHNLINSFSQQRDGQNISNNIIELTEQRLAWLAQLDKTPEPLIQHLKTLKSSRIGLYFESLWQFFLRHDQQYRLITHNLKVYRNKITYGEIDLIYQDTYSGQYTHLELAIKFYLNQSLTGPSSVFSNDYHHWVGPNAIDRLDKKLNRLLSHQIQLSNSDEARLILQAKGVDEVNQEIALKGYLFYPLNLPSSEMTSKQEQPIAWLPQQNYWLKLNQFDSIISQSIYWLWLQKPQWISPAYGTIAASSEQLIHGNDIAAVLKDYFDR